MSDLIARLEAAEEGSRELSDEVLLACGWAILRDPGIVTHRSPKGEIYYDPPSPTESVDDALGLVPEGCDWWHITSSATACLAFNGEGFHGEGATPALALCAAILRASDTGDGK